MGAFDKTLGTLLVGIIFNTYLYGLVSYQFAAYYNAKFNDPRWIKIVVFILFIVDTFHSAALVYMAWGYCVTNFNNPDILAVALWPFTFTPIGTAIAAIFTHIFLGYRIMRLTNNKFIYAGILVLAAVSFALGVVCGVWSTLLFHVAKFGVLNGVVTAWLSFQVGVDLLITGILTTVLYRSRTGFHKTDTVIRRLIRGAVQTGVFASIFSLGDLVAFLTSTDSNLYGMFAFPVGRIYTNTLMDTLVSRAELKTLISGDVDMDTPSNAIWATTANNNTRAPTQTGIQLHKIQVQTDIFTDGNNASNHRDSSDLSDTKYNAGDDFDASGSKSIQVV